MGGQRNNRRRPFPSSARIRRVVSTRSAPHLHPSDQIKVLRQCQAASPLSTTKSAILVKDGFNQFLINRVIFG